MDGLEISEISLQELNRRNQTSRIDSNFFSKRALQAYDIIKKQDVFYLGKAEIVNGPFGSTITADTHRSSGFMPLVRSLNIRNGFYIDDKDLVYISQQENQIIAHSQLKVDDIVLSRVGSIGFFARVDERMGECNISSNNIGIKLDRYGVNQKHFILTYLNTKYAQILVQQRVTGNVQPKLTVEDISSIPIPTFSEQFYSAISVLIKNSEHLREVAKKSYYEAEQQLVSKIGITTNGSMQTFAVKTYSETKLSNERLDAEYYQPKYDELFNILRKFTTANLGGENGLVSITKSIEPGSEAYRDEGIPFVRVSDVNKFELADPEIMLSPTIVPNIESLYPRKDTILLSKDGSVGIAYKLEEERQIVTSGALLHLTIKNTGKILPDYLTLVLNSPIVQLQAERDCNGAIIQHWIISDIEKVVIPVLDMEKQKEIAEKVQESFRLRKEAKLLLDRAIKAVEMAIETDEDTALLWLELQ